MDYTERELCFRMIRVALRERNHRLVRKYVYEIALKIEGASTDIYNDLMYVKEMSAIGSTEIALRACEEIQKKMSAIEDKDDLAERQEFDRLNNEGRGNY